MIWHLDPFDQWGVELGKVLGEAIHRELATVSASKHDPSTRALIQTIQKTKRSRR